VEKNPFSFYLVIKIQNVSSSKLSSNKIQKENKYLFETHPALSVVDVEKQKQLVSQFFFFSFFVSMFLCFFAFSAFPLENYENKTNVARSMDPSWFYSFLPSAILLRFNWLICFRLTMNSQQQSRE
jgi:hypothetical protein